MEDAQLNFYDHLEWLKTIYVSRLDELNKQDNRYHEETQKLEQTLIEMRKLIDTLKSLLKQKSSIICELQTKLEIKEKEVQFLKGADSEMARTAENYYKIPRLIRRVFVSE